MAERGAQYLLLIKASIRAGVRPTTMILGEDNRKRWSEMDVLIMQAFEILEAERCPDCGYYIWICQSEDPHIDWKVEKVKPCDAKLAVKEFDETHKKKNDEDDDVRGRPIPKIRNDAFPISDLRRRYYDALAAESAQD